MDLCLYKTLLRYRSVNSVIAKSALRVFKRHLWYLTQEMVVLAIFYTNVLIKESQDMADRLILIKPAALPITPVNRFGKGYAKPLWILTLVWLIFLVQTLGTPSTFLCDIS